ncbi:MAG: CRISPR-associated endoribonuclease Cas6 [Chitinophagales bacterium]
MVRIRLTFQLQDKRQNQLPINYQYAVSAWIYKMLHSSNPGFSEWLHNQGYSLENKKFKLFCFSELQFGENGCRFRHPDRLQISALSFDLVVSMAVPEAVNYFVMGIFREQNLVLGDRVSQVPLRLRSVETLIEPDFSTTTQKFTALSPICVSRPELRNDKPIAQYLDPTDVDFERILLANLQNKYRAFLQSSDITNLDWGIAKMSFCLLNIRQKRLIHVPRKDMRPIKVRGYLMDFELTAPVDLLRFGYFAGFGEKNAGLGFGCVEGVN